MLFKSPHESRGCNGGRGVPVVCLPLWRDRHMVRGLLQRDAVLKWERTLAVYSIIGRVTCHKSMMRLSKRLPGCLVERLLVVVCCCLAARLLVAAWVERLLVFAWVGWFVGLLWHFEALCC